MAKFTKFGTLAILVLTLILATALTGCTSTEPAPTAAPAAPDPTTAAPAAPDPTTAAPVAAPSMAATPTAAASSAADSELKSFYNGKLLSITVPQKAGATSDTIARFIANYLAEELGVRVQVENETSASGLVARNGFYNNAKPDGLNLLLEPTGSLMGDWAMGSSGVNYDITKLNYIGGLKRGPLVVTAAPNGPYKAIQDMIDSKDELNFASMAPGSLITLSNMAALEILGINGKVVTGFGGATERALAIQQGQVAGAVYNMEWASTQAKEGQISILVQIRAEKDSNYPDTPALGDVVELTDAHRALLAAIVPDGTMIAAPPDTPADKVQFLRATIDKIMADEAFKADIVKVLPPWLGTWTGQDVKDIADEVAKEKPNFADAYGELTKKYVK
jgi:tripartite-type tricarboxylate transporter receptor subunit TctC